MEKALFPLKYMKQTQGVNGVFSHLGTLAIDYGNRGYREPLYAPFTGYVRRIVSSIGNAVWFESENKVLWADGTIDHMVILCIHANNISDLTEGKKINQGEKFYEMGDSGNATGIHVHIEIGQGRYSGNGWQSSPQGKAVVIGSRHPADGLFLTEDIEVVNDGGYAFKKLIGTPVTKVEGVNQIKINVFNLRCRTEPNGQILGYVNEGYYNVLERKDLTDYSWIMIEQQRWIAHHSDWSTLYLVKETGNGNEIPVVTPEPSVPEEPASGQPSNPETIFEYAVKKSDLYAIELNEGETLMITKEK